jgi:hypothetical protein
MLSTTEKFQKLIQPLLDLPVSLPWKGFGSAVFLELGSLAPPESPRLHHHKGEACISVEWDWRVEAEAEILYGSSNSRPKIEAGIQTLQGATVQALSVAGQIPELVVQFSNGHRLRSMVMVAGDPEWLIRLPDGMLVYARRGRLIVRAGEASESEKKQGVFTLAERTAARWGAPEADPKLGSCVHCAFYVRLDGEGRFLNYGGCMAESGPFDGRVVAKNSGCPAFILPQPERTAARWGVPKVEPKKGSCAQCLFFVPLDGEAHLIDYGCCCAESGPFDGRITDRNSGCPAFIRDEEP